MNENTVVVTSMSNSRVILTLPEYHVLREWPKKGAKQMIPKDLLRETIYQPGVGRLFTEGFLYIDDVEFQKELGLIEEDENGKVEPLIALDDKLMNRIIKLMPINEVETTLNKLTMNQRKEVSDYAINHYEELKMDRIDVISKYCEVNLLKAIENRKLMEV